MVEKSCIARSDDFRECNTMFNLAGNRGNQIEVIKTVSTATMADAGEQKQPGKLLRC
jgi:hypothetical protein